MSEDADDPGAVRVELAVRTLSPDGGGNHQAELIERLRDLERRGGIDEFSVEVWGKRVGLTNADAGTDHGRRVVETVESFREWADDRDLAVGTFFRTRRVENRITGESYTALELPSMALAEYRDGDLHRMGPCLDPETGETRSVVDRVEAIEADHGDRTAGTETPPPAITVAEE